MRAHTASLRVRMTTAVFATALAVAAFGLLAAADAGAKAKKEGKADEAVEKGPKGLAFYKPPKGFSKTHGDLIWARKAKGLVPLGDAKYTKLVLYSSRTPQGVKTAVSGSVSVPKGKPPKGGWPVISYAHGTTGAADLCAPTRNAVGNSAQPYTSYIDANLNEWLRNGYAVVRTDYQGLGTAGPHPYLVGKAEGRGILDIVAAARDLDDRIGKRFLIAGHSQGGHSALFAAGDAGAWTPKLKLRGTVAFAPASHLLEQASLLPSLTTPSPLTALAVMILHGCDPVRGDQHQRGAFGRGAALLPAARAAVPLAARRVELAGRHPSLAHPARGGRHHGPVRRAREDEPAREERGAHPHLAGGRRHHRVQAVH